MTEHEKLVKEHEDSLGSGVIVRDFYFKGGYQLKQMTDSYTGEDYTDIIDCDPHIRVVGTLKETSKICNDFMKRHKNLLLDEVFEYEVYKKDNFYYDLLKNPEQRNKEVFENIKLYKEKYAVIGAFIV